MKAYEVYLESKFSWKATLSLFNVISIEYYFSIVKRGNIKI